MIDLANLGWTTDLTPFIAASLLDLDSIPDDDFPDIIHGLAIADSAAHAAILSAFLKDPTP